VIYKEKHLNELKLPLAELAGALLAAGVDSCPSTGKPLHQKPVTYMHIPTRAADHAANASEAQHQRSAPVDSDGSSHYGSCILHHGGHCD